MKKVIRDKNEQHGDECCNVKSLTEGGGPRSWPAGKLQRKRTLHNVTVLRMETSVLRICSAIGKGALEETVRVCTMGWSICSRLPTPTKQQRFDLGQPLTPKNQYLTPPPKACLVWERLTYLSTWTLLGYPCLHADNAGSTYSLRALSHLCKAIPLADSRRVPVRQQEIFLARVTPAH